MMKSSSAPPELQACKTERFRSLDGKTSVWEVFPFALQQVLGGILLVIMGQILVSGIEMISKAGFTARNKLIIALSLAVGIGFGEAAGQGIWANFPILLQSIFSKNIVSVVFVTTFLLNLLLPSSLEEQHRSSSDGFETVL